MSKTRGRVTLPSESGFLNETRELMERWGADAIRDSDGTKLDRDVKSLDAEIYTTYFVARGHNEFAVKHMEECQQLYLMSRRFTAVGNHLEMDLRKIRGKLYCADIFTMRPRPRLPASWAFHRYRFHGWKNVY